MGLFILTLQSGRDKPQALIFTAIFCSSSGGHSNYIYIIKWTRKAWLSYLITLNGTNGKAINY